MNVADGGRLRDAADAPVRGERTHVLATTRDFSVEQILSGRLGAPVDDDQDHDEWVVVLEGGAVVEVDGTERALRRGDWLVLPARVPHRVVSAEAGTSWLAVRGRGQDRRPRDGGPR